MKNVFFKTKEAVAKRSGAMESGDHFKNGASPKSHTSRGVFFIIISFVLLAVISGCSKDDSEHSILGTWRSANNTSYTFKADKTGTFVLMGVNAAQATFTWTIDGTKVKITRTSSTALLFMATEIFFDHKTNTFYDVSMPSLIFTKQ